MPGLNVMSLLMSCVSIQSKFEATMVCSLGMYTPLACRGVLSLASRSMTSSLVSLSSLHGELMIDLSTNVFPTFIAFTEPLRASSALTYLTKGGGGGGRELCWVFREDHSISEMECEDGVVME